MQNKSNPVADQKGARETGSPSSVLQADDATVLPGGWEKAEQKFGIDSPEKKDVLPEKSEAILLERKKKSKKRDMYDGVKRNFLEKTEDYGTGPQKVPVQQGWWSDSVKDYYYAPGDTGSAGLSAAADFDMEAHVPLNTVNRAVRALVDPSFQFIAGDGYYYLISNDPDKDLKLNGLFSTNVSVNRATQLTLGAWIEHAEDFKKEMEVEAENARKLRGEVETANYQDDTWGFEKDQGFSSYDRDTNFTNRTRPRIAKNKDRDKRQDSKSPTGSPDPMDYSMTQNLGNLTYPLAGTLIQLVAETKSGSWAWGDAQRFPAEDAPGGYFGFAVPTQPDDVESLKEGEMDFFLVFRLHRRGGRYAKELRYVSYSDPKLGPTRYGARVASEISTAFSDVLFDSMPREVVKEAIALVDTEATKKMREEEKKKEETSKKKRERLENPNRKNYDVLTDPSLAEAAPGITDVERLFTGIKKWNKNVFMADPKKLDETTLGLLEKTPKGDGKYFKWIYTTEDEIKERLAKDKSAQATEPTIWVVKKPAWDEALTKLGRA